MITSLPSGVRKNIAIKATLIRAAAMNPARGFHKTARAQSTEKAARGMKKSWYCASAPSAMADRRMSATAKLAKIGEPDHRDYYFQRSLSIWNHSYQGRLVDVDCSLHPRMWHAIVV